MSPAAGAADSTGNPVLFWFSAEVDETGKSAEPVTFLMLPLAPVAYEYQTIVGVVLSVTTNARDMLNWLVLAKDEATTAPPDVIAPGAEDKA